MQPTFTELKLMARTSLKPKWPEAIAVSMVLTALALLNIILQYILMTIFKVDTVWSLLDPTALPKYSAAAAICITLFSVVYDLFVCLPFAIGALRWFWLTLHGADPAIGEVFYYFSSSKRFFKAVAVAFALLLLVHLGAVICYIPYIIFYLIVNPEVYNFFGYSMPVFVSGLFPLVNFSSVICSLMLMFWIARYALFFVPMFSEPELSVRGIIRETVKLTRGKLFRLIGFVFSFFGWMLLSLLVLPIIFIVPFALASVVAYGREEKRFAAAEKAQFQSF